MLVVTKVTGTCNYERVWFCVVRDTTSRKRAQTMALTAAHARHLIAKQELQGYLGPQFLIEHAGPMVMNLRGPNRDPTLVYRNCKFVGFQHWEFVPVTTVQSVLRQKKRRQRKNS